jgi:hypothetical protein
VGEDQAAYQQAGWLPINSGSDQHLKNLLKTLISHFYRVSNFDDITPPSARATITKISGNYSQKSKRVLASPASLGASEEINQSHHYAPSLTEEDAAQIKGMLKRGDKPQDIAFYFGVNNGRISEIKSGVKFTNVSTAPLESLPPKGPYPPIRDLLNFVEDSK